MLQPPASYLQRYEALQQERLRDRQARASDALLASPASADGSDGFERALVPPRHDGASRADAFRARPATAPAAAGDDGDDDGDAFDFAQTLDAPALAQSAAALSVASDEFEDAVAFLEKNQLGGDDSFALEVAQQQQPPPSPSWEQDESRESGRPSDFFERRSRNLERVEFALENERNSSVDAEEAAGGQAVPAASARQYASLASSDANTALSSGFEVHFDCTRQAFTPNSLQYLQEKKRIRNSTALPEEEDSTELESSRVHTNEARNDLQRLNGQRLAMLDSDESEDELPESIQAMQRGPGVIVDTLNEIESLLSIPRSAAGGARRDHRTPATVQDIVREYDLSLETGLPLSRTTDSWGDDPEDDHRDEPVSRSPQSRDLRASNPELGTIREPRFNSISTNTNQLYQINEECEQFGEDDEPANNAPAHDAGSRKILPRREAKEQNVEGLSMNPSQTMTERIVFSNGSDAVGRISVSLLPLSTGCQQFSVSPAVLELRPKASSAFYVTLKARTPGVAAGIFQFRGVGVKSLFSPYEVLIEASVRRNLAIEELDASGKVTSVAAAPARDRQVEELRRSKCINEVDVGPTFVKFERLKVKNGVKMPSSSSLKITNNSDAALPFKISCAHENLKIAPSSGTVPPASEVTVTMLPLAQPFERRKNAESLASARSAPVPERWTGSFSVVVGEKVSREVSFVIAREVLETLPPFDSIARSRHQISSQTDAFYYTKKRHRRGLYFHARAVECGSCSVGESHEVPVYICNGSSSPMTVFLQDLMDPFSCFYTTTTIEPRKFIEVPVAFTPKVAGKVSTSLFAYSVTDKAVVTLVARGL